MINLTPNRSRYWGIIDDYPENRLRELVRFEPHPREDYFVVEFLGDNIMGLRELCTTTVFKPSFVYYDEYQMAEKHPEYLV